MKPGTPTILPTITIPNKPSKSYQCTQGPRQTQVTLVDLCAGQFLCPGVPRGWQRAKVMSRGGKERMVEKDFKRRWKLPLKHARTTQSRLSKDNQLRCECSPEGGGIERSFLGFWAQSVSVVRSAGDSWTLPICTPQPANTSHTYWKGWFMHSSW